MKNEKVIAEEKINVMLDKLTDYALNNENYQILILGKPEKSDSFKKKQYTSTDFELLWKGWFGPWWSQVFVFLRNPSQLILVKNRSRLKELYEDIGEMTFCELYFADHETREKIIKIVSNRQREGLVTLVQESERSFMIEVYFDGLGGERDGKELYVMTCAGKNVDDHIIDVLTLE